jgi:O-antigen/teichoic acid export membrane protein
VVSRRDAWELLRIMIAAAIVNVLLNLALIPSWGATGAAAAMLGSSAVFAALSLRVSLHETGRIGLVSLIAAPVVAGVAMAVPLFVLRPALVPALLAGSLVYVLVAALVERIVDPADFRFAAGLVRRVLPSRRRGGPLARSAP